MFCLFAISSSNLTLKILMPQCNVLLTRAIRPMELLSPEHYHFILNYSISGNTEDPYPGSKYRNSKWYIILTPILFCLDHESWWFQMVCLPISFRVASLALGQHFPSASEATLNDMGKVNQYQITKKKKKKHKICVYFLVQTLFNTCQELNLSLKYQDQLEQIECMCSEIPSYKFKKIAKN